jgi:hypothetical protein
MYFSCVLLVFILRKKPFPNMNFSKFYSVHHLSSRSGILIISDDVQKISLIRQKKLSNSSDKLGCVHWAQGPGPNPQSIHKKCILRGYTTTAHEQIHLARIIVWLTLDVDLQIMLRTLNWLNGFSQVS